MNCELSYACCMVSCLVFETEKCERNLPQIFFCCITPVEYVLQEEEKKKGKVGQLSQISWSLVLTVEARN